MNFGFSVLLRARAASSHHRAQRKILFLFGAAACTAAVVRAQWTALAARPADLAALAGAGVGALGIAYGAVPAWAARNLPPAAAALALGALQSAARSRRRSRA